MNEYSRSRLKKVFCHEAGHYIAQHLNSLSGVGEGTKEILLIAYGDEYEGQTTPITPPNIPDNLPVVNLPEKIAECTYGCYIQSLFLDLELSTCYSCENKNVAGYKDAEMVANGLKKFRVDVEKRKKLFYFLEIEYFEEIKKYKEIFQPLFDLKIDYFLLKTSQGFSVDLDELHKVLKSTLSNHQNQYLTFIEKIKTIISWDEIKNNKL